MTIVETLAAQVGKEVVKLRESSLVRNTGWMVAGQGAGVILQTVSFIFLARLLSNTDYGIYVGAVAFCNLTAQYASLGMGTVFLRYVSVDYSLFNCYWGNILVGMLVMGGLLTLILPILGHYLLNPSSAALVLLLTISNCFCGQLTIEIARIFQTYEKMRVTSALNLLTQLARTIAVLVMIATIHRATAWQWTVVSLLVSVVAATAAVWVVIGCFGWPRFKMKLFFARAFEGLNYSFASSTSTVYNDIDKTMLSHYGMNYANGIYTLAYRLVDVASIPIYAIRDAALPRLFQRGHSGIVSASELSNHLLKRTLIIGVLSASGLALISPLVPHLVGAGFAESAGVLRWLCLIPVFRCVHQMAGSALAGGGFQRYRTLAQVFVGSFNFFVNLWLIPQYGWHGAAWSSLATDGALAAVNLSLLIMLTSKATLRQQDQI
jgi:O-antigen/teichoic acid export membrane protein